MIGYRPSASNFAISYVAKFIPTMKD